MDRPTPRTSREPNPFIRRAAQAYNEKYGFEKIIDNLYVAVDVNRARRIVNAYEALQVDDSGNAAVSRAYGQLAEEIEQQWIFALESMGIILEP